MTSKTPLLGAHVSIAQGFYKSIIRGEELGASCIQIFTKSNRQWYAKPISEKNRQLFADYQSKSSVQVVVAHASYLINLGSSNSEVVTKSIKALIEELERCETLRIPYLVLHPGTKHSTNEQESLLFIAHQLDIALNLAKPKHVTLLLETMAGQGSTVGNTLEQLATILKHSKNKKHLGICLDTCHIFAAGYQFNTPATYKSFWLTFDKTIGIKNLKVIHINDSKKDCKSHIDRHEHIGKGKIGLLFFKLLLRDKKLSSIPKILETPLTHPTDHLNNMKTIKNLL